jgi:hypothetical protein
MARPDITPEQLLALTPQRYLAKGWLDANGQPLAPLSSGYALAACQQLLQAQVSPQEVGAVLSAFDILLPLYRDTAHQRLPMVTEDALGSVRSTLGQTNHPGLLAWLEPCVLAVKTEADLAAFMAHLRAVTQQYAALIASRLAQGRA